MLATAAVYALALRAWRGRGVIAVKFTQLIRGDFVCIMLAVVCLHCLAAEIAWSYTRRDLHIVTEIAARAGRRGGARRYGGRRGGGRRRRCMQRTARRRSDESVKRKRMALQTRQIESGKVCSERFPTQNIAAGCAVDREIHPPVAAMSP
eukprot:1473780-Pleurochrysis_carterae.AAC.1